VIGDKAYDSDAFREALIEREITLCILPRAKRQAPATYCKALYKHRHKIENMFAKLKDWRRISTRYDRYAYTFFSDLHRSHRHILDRSMSPDPRHTGSIHSNCFNKAWENPRYSQPGNIWDKLCSCC